MAEREAEITQLLQAAWSGGDRAALDALLPQLYDALRRMAAGRIASQDGPVTLNPTALVHEALLKLLGSETDWHSRSHFLAVASLQMRAVLVDHARAKAAQKRGGGALQVTLSALQADVATPGEAELELLALDQALNQLGEHDARMARVVAMTYFGGMQRDEIAAVEGISVPTVDRDLRFARAFLNRAMGGG